METIPTNSQLNWEFVEPLNENALSGLEDQLKMGLSDAFKDFVKRSNYGFSQWRSFMVGNKSYTFKHVLNFNLEGKGLFIDFMKSLKEWLEPEEIIFANDGYGGYYLLNTASGVVLFLDTDDGSKHTLLHLKMFLIKRELKDLQREQEFWTKSSQFRVSVPVGWEINHKEVCFEIGEAQNHTLICGHNGSGKSNFLHVLIQNLAFYYAPNEIQLFLLDYKEGVEFNAYADPAILEHARLVSVASSVSFGVSFLNWLDKETKKRGELFKQFNVKDLSDYRKHGEMPRLIVVIDEFQVLFSDSTIKEKERMEAYLTTLLKKGRSYGVHLILATQTMRGADINKSLMAQIANRIALPMDAEDSESVLSDDVACELVKPEGIFNNNGGHQKYHTKMSIPKAPDDFKPFIKKIHKEFNQRNLAPIEHKIYNGEKALEMPNTFKANEMRLHLGKEVDYEQKDLIVEFESNESHLLVVSQDLNARIALMKLFAQNFKTANKELLFYNAEKRLVRELDELKKHHITPMQSPLGSVLDTAMNPNSVLMIDNLNEVKELHDKIGVEKLRSFLEKATDNEQYCIIFAHDFKQINANYNLDKLKELLNNHFKQRLAFKCNRENLSVLKSEQKLHELNARLINASKDSHTEFKPFSLYGQKKEEIKKGGVKKTKGI
ncbi:hypothetical protein JP0016_01610 [Helicobacter pylori]